MTDNHITIVMWIIGSCMLVGWVYVFLIFRITKSRCNAMSEAYNYNTREVVHSHLPISELTDDDVRTIMRVGILVSRNGDDELLGKYNQLCAHVLDGLGKKLKKSRRIKT